MIEQRRARSFLLALSALLLVGAGRTTAPPRDPETARRDLTLLLNRERELAGVPLLSPASPLAAVAQARAEEIQAHRSTRGSPRRPRRTRPTCSRARITTT